MLNSLSMVKGLYKALQDALMDISHTLGVELLLAAEHIKMLSKKKEMEDLQARVDCLLRENNDFKGEVATKESRLRSGRSSRNELAC